MPEHVGNQIYKQPYSKNLSQCHSETFLCFAVDNRMFVVTINVYTAFITPFPAADRA